MDAIGRSTCIKIEQSSETQPSSVIPRAVLNLNCHPRHDVIVGDIMITILPLWPSSASSLLYRFIGPKTTPSASTSTVHSPKLPQQAKKEEKSLASRGLPRSS